MVTKLILPTQDHTLTLLLKTGVFALLSVGLLLSGGVISALLFIVGALVLFHTPLANTVPYIVSFLVLCLLTLVGMWHWAGVQAVYGLVGVSILFYIVLGLKSFRFVHRTRWHYLLALGLVYISYLLFFTSDLSRYVSIRSLTVYGIAFVIFREFFIALFHAHRQKKSLTKFAVRAVHQPRVIAAVAALLITETLWVVRLLPLSDIQSANSLLLITFILTELLQRTAKGELTRNSTLTLLTVGIGILLMIFLLTEWSLAR